MLLRLPVNSRRANRLLLVVGLLFVAASAALLVYYVIDTAGAAALTDRLLQAMLACAGAYGAWLARAAQRNLSISRSATRKSGALATQSTG